MAPEHQQEVDRAFAAIRALCRGDAVPPPPRYFDDTSDVLDLMRGAAWVAHALFEPDADGENVIEFEVYEPGAAQVVLVPSQAYDHETGKIIRDGWAMRPVLDAIAACDEVLAAGVQDGPDAAPFSCLRRKPSERAGEEIIAQIQRRLDKRGRVPAGDGWPRIDLTDQRIANTLMGDLVGHVSDMGMSLRAVSRLSGVRPVSYPVRAGGISSRRYAEFALGRLADAVQTVSRDYRLQREIAGEMARRDRAAEEARMAVAAARAETLAKHGDALRDIGTPAASAVLAFLETGRKMPVYKGSEKRPTPERDALIDGIHDLLGEDAHEALAALVSSDEERNAKGVRDLGVLLDEALRSEGPRP